MTCDARGCGPRHEATTRVARNGRWTGSRSCTCEIVERTKRVWPVGGSIGPRCEAARRCVAHAGQRGAITGAARAHARIVKLSFRVRRRSGRIGSRVYVFNRLRGRTLRRSAEADPARQGACNSGPNARGRGRFRRYKMTSSPPALMAVEKPPLRAEARRSGGCHSLRCRPSA